MPNNTLEKWEEKKLAELCNIEIGKTPSRSDKKYWDKDFLTNNTWLSIADLNNTENKHIYKSKEQVSDIAIQNMKIVKKGTLLLSFKLTIGRVAFAGKDLYTNEAIVQLPIKNEKEIDKNYLYYYFQYFNYDILLKGDIKVKGKALNKEKLKILPVIYPELYEQQRIVGVLDEAFENIEKAKQNALQNLNNAKELFDNYLNQIFIMKKGWIEKKLDYVCIYKSGTTISKDLEKEQGDLLYIKVGDMNLQGNEECITTSTRYADLKDINKNQIINNGAIIFPKRGGAIATNKKRKIIKPTIIDLNTMAISTNDEILDDYFYYWFKQINLIDISNGTTIPQINNYSFKDLKIAYPVDKHEQQKIVSQLDELQEQTKKLEQIYKQKINDLDELKQSILQKAFNGEL